MIVDDIDEWFVAQTGDNELTIMRMLDVPVVIDVIGQPKRDAAFLTVVHMDNRTNLEPGWYVGSSGDCAVTVDLGTLTVPAISLDPAALPDPSDTSIQILITEQTCNSGRDASGRVEVVDIRQGDTSIGVVIGITPNTGGADCPSNPPTPLILTLDAPLGERRIVNETLASPRPVTAPKPLERTD